MRSLPRFATALALAAVLAACGGGTDGDPATDGGTTSDTPTSSDSADDTSTPADDVEPTGEVTQAEAEAVGTAYLGLTEEEAQSQAEVDGRQFRVGERDGEQFALTEDYVLGRVTATITDGVVTEVVVEATDGPVTVAAS